MWDLFIRKTSARQKDFIKGALLDILIWVSFVYAILLVLAAACSSYTDVSLILGGIAAATGAVCIKVVFMLRKIRKNNKF